MTETSTTILVVGLAITGRAVADAALSRGYRVVVCDDRTTDATRAAAAERGITVVESPDETVLSELIAACDMVVPSPGVPRHHAVYRLADAQGRPIVSEFDLAAEWDDRPLVAITGTNGKTTVTTLVTQMLNRAGVTAVAAGNVDAPLVEAIDDTSEPRAEVFVVEASSFRLERVSRFAPRVGAWLNFAPDHLDWHDNLDQYAQAKARIWAAGGASTVAVVPAGDALITDAAARYGAPTVTFGIGDGDVSWVDDVLYLDGAPVVRLDQIRRRLRHDQLNAAAAVAIASQMGASIDAMAAVLGDFAGLDHRMALVATIDGVAWYDDSKATTPDATVAGVSGLTNAVLIAGGRNKGLDFAPLAQLAPHLVAVVAIGETASIVAELFDTLVPVDVATSMAQAVTLAAARTTAEAVVLSPACASFDWYANYVERGRDFARLVRALPTSEGVTS